MNMTFWGSIYSINKLNTIDYQMSWMGISFADSDVKHHKIE